MIHSLYIVICIYLDGNTHLSTLILLIFFFPFSLFLSVDTFIFSFFTSIRTLFILSPPSIQYFSFLFPFFFSHYIHLLTLLSLLLYFFLPSTQKHSNFFLSHPFFTLFFFRYIPAAAAFGGMCIGLLTVLADFLGKRETHTQVFKTM